VRATATSFPAGDRFASITSNAQCRCRAAHAVAHQPFILPFLAHACRRALDRTDMLPVASDTARQTPSERGGLTPTDATPPTTPRGFLLSASAPPLCVCVYIYIYIYI
jgi:hypothetical protein